MSFMDLLEKQEDKITLNELILLQKMLPEGVTEAVPYCIYKFKKDKDGNDERNAKGDRITDGLNYEVFSILAWVLAKRENPDITLEEVGDRIGLLAPDNLPKIEREIWYFTTTTTREVIEGMPQEGIEESENPTPTQVESPPS